MSNRKAAKIQSKKATRSKPSQTSGVAQKATRRAKDAPKTALKAINGHSAAVALDQSNHLLLRIGATFAEFVQDLAEAQATFRKAESSVAGGLYRNGTIFATVELDGSIVDLVGTTILPATGDIKPAVVDALEPATMVSIPAKYLRAALSISPKNDARPSLNGIYLHRVDGQVRIVSTDGHRLLVIAKDGPDLDWLEAGVILPRGAIERIAKFLGNDPAAAVDVHFGIGHGNVTIVETAGMASFNVAPMVGPYIDYQRVIDAGGDVLTEGREPTDAGAMNAKYLKDAGAISAQLKSDSIFCFAPTSTKSPTLFTFGGEAGAVLFVMPLQTTAAALQDSTVRIIGKSGMAGSLAALKAHETRTLKAAKEAKSESAAETLRAKAQGYRDRADAIRAALLPQLAAPKDAPPAEDAAEEAFAH